MHGRWLNRDPIGEEGGRNLYSFATNDGLNRWDLLGLLDIEKTGEGWFGDPLDASADHFILKPDPGNDPKLGGTTHHKPIPSLEVKEVNGVHCVTGKIDYDFQIWINTMPNVDPRLRSRAGRLRYGKRHVLALRLRMRKIIDDAKQWKDAFPSETEALSAANDYFIELSRLLQEAVRAEASHRDPTGEFGTPPAERPFEEPDV